MAQVLQETRRESVMSAAKLSETAKGVYIIAATPFTDDGALEMTPAARALTVWVASEAD